MEHEEPQWKNDFYERYKKSAIYHELYADWFPEDVMQFILRQRNDAFELGKQEGIRMAMEAVPKPFQSLSPVADRPKIECNHCWVLWNRCREQMISALTSLVQSKE